MRNFVQKVLLDLGSSSEEIKVVKGNGNLNAFLEENKRFQDLLLTKEFSDISVNRFRDLIKFHRNLLLISDKLGKTTANETTITLIVLEFMLIFTFISLYSVSRIQPQNGFDLITYLLLFDFRSAANNSCNVWH